MAQFRHCEDCKESSKGVPKERFNFLIFTDTKFTKLIFNCGELVKQFSVFDRTWILQEYISNI